MAITNNTGNVHSIETFGTVDGPGIRLVVFMQGCPMRCLYCHNPDTWNTGLNNKYSADDILLKYESIKEFLKTGGITLSGGEPLMQIDFCISLFKKARTKKIHTALDTSGILFNEINIDKINDLLKYTDLILLDIKHINDDEHKKLTGFSNKNVLDFALYLSEQNKPVWIRHVAVPDITFKERHLKQLGRFLSGLKNVQALDILPYHNMAAEKYKKLNIEYKLKDTEPLTKDEAVIARDIILNEMKRGKNIGITGDLFNKKSV